MARSEQMELFPDLPAPAPPATGVDVDVATMQAELTELRAALLGVQRGRAEFLRALAHELRTPLTTVLGWANMLSSGELSEPERRRAAESVDRNARLLVGRLEQLLDHERARTGVAVPAAPVDVRALVSEVLHGARFTAQAKGIALTHSVPPAPALVLGHADGLRQALWNLVHNALKFTGRAGRIDVTVAPHDDDTVELQVSDTGAGIAPDALPEVLRAARGGAVRRVHGMELGLAFSRQVAELHGGRLRAHSAGAGLGSTFTLCLPRHASGLGSLAAPPPRSPADVPLDGISVLLVDDDPAARDVLAAILEECGARVTSAGSAGEALDALRHADPDVLISDISMPGEDGYALIRKVRALCLPPARRIPAAAVTAHGELEDRVRALSEGYQIHLAKPVEPQKLTRVIAQLAGRTAAP